MVNFIHFVQSFLVNKNYVRPRVLTLKSKKRPFFFTLKKFTLTKNYQKKAYFWMSTNKLNCLKLKNIDEKKWNVTNDELRISLYICKRPIWRHLWHKSHIHTKNKHTKICHWYTHCTITMTISYRNWKNIYPKLKPETIYCPVVPISSVPGI